MFGRKLSLLTADQSTDVDNVVKRVESDFMHQKFPPGFNPRVKHFQMTLDPILFYHRPLLIYILTYLFNFVGYAWLRLCGFERRCMGVVPYWYRPAEPGPGLADSHLPPVVFFHGITPGWLVYLPSVFAIIGCRPTLLIDLDAIKINSLVFDMPTESDFVDGVTNAIDLHFGTAAKVSIVGHSFGTISSTWFLRHKSCRVAHLTLIDPVSLLLGLPDVAHNFLHKVPDSIIKLIMRLMASREITVSNMLHRHFWWYNNILILEDLPPGINVVIGLPGKDEIANNRVVLDYVRLLQTAPHSPLPPGITTSVNNGSVIVEDIRAKRASGGNSIEVAYWPEATHASILFDSSAQREIIGIMRTSEGGKDVSHSRHS
jgi:pimeloyl-ACP methyl ester carboxylesterase